MKGRWDRIGTVAEKLQNLRLKQAVFSPKPHVMMHRSGAAISNCRIRQPGSTTTPLQEICKDSEFLSGNMVVESHSETLAGYSTI